MNNKKIANELVKLAKELVSGDGDFLKEALKDVDSFMDVRKALKKAKIKYDFSTSIMPAYMVKDKGSLWGIVNIKNAEDADFVINGKIAVGRLS
jgi:hypothetical protein